VSTGVVPVRYNDRLDPAGVYIDRTEPVLRPFGFGLGFRAAPVVGLTAAYRPDRVEVEVRLANETDAAVPEVIQVYGRRAGGSRWPRVRELLAFRRVAVPPGGAVIEFAIPGDEAFAGPSGTTMIMVGEQRAEVARLSSTASCPAPR
jgi:beta-glucosidase